MAPPYEEWVCNRCHEGADVCAPIKERYSFGCYAGRYCDACWLKSGYRDATDPSAVFDPADAGETMDPESDALGSEREWY